MERGKVYCYECDNEIEYEIKTRHKVALIREVEVECDVDECFCKKCGSYVLVERIEKKNEIKMYDEYKKKVGLLTSGEIKDLLKKRNISQRQLSKLLSIGEKDITRYINGAIQSRIIDKMLRLVMDDEGYSRINSLFLEDKQTSKKVSI